MLRTLIAAAAVYACGHPAFDGYRPAGLDKPLQSFYVEVNLAARDGQRALASLDGARAMRYLDRYIARVDAELRSEERPQTIGP
ncbi:MAG: hypothetical protein ABSC37_06090 [Xanthobacteraceae bacterium]